MNDLMARATAITTVFLALAALGALYFTSHPELRGGQEIKAEFADAYPLLEGMHVRVGGAVAGSVREIELGDNGHANITMQLHEGTSPARADALAAIRQEDITGDSYISLSLGQDEEPLGNECEAFGDSGDPCIGTKDTGSAPRFDDLLNAFNEPVRQGLELVFVELGRTLEGRGEDLNRAALELRPGIEAANQALAELNSQNAALRSLIADAEAVNAQAAERSAELGRLVGSLATSLNSTAQHLPALDSALDVLPETLRAGHGTMTRLSRMVAAARPLAVTLGEAAPDLVRTVTLLGPFTADAEAILRDVEPTLDAVSKVLIASLPTLRASPKQALTAPFDLTAGLGSVLDLLVGDKKLLEALFGAECYGGRVCDPTGEVGLGAIAVDSGEQVGWETNDPERFFTRAVAVPSCEMFGVKIEPGCFEEIPASIRNLAGILPGILPVNPPGAQRTSAPDASRPRAEPPDALGDAPDRVLDDLATGIGELGLGGAPDRDTKPKDLDSLLDFVLGP